MQHKIKSHYIWKGRALSVATIVIKGAKKKVNGEKVNLEVYIHSSCEKVGREKKEMNGSEDKSRKQNSSKWKNFNVFKSRSWKPIFKGDFEHHEGDKCNNKNQLWDNSISVYSFLPWLFLIAKSLNY